MSYKVCAVFALSVFMSFSLWSQEFKFGADLSYVNEMEDCGVNYLQEGEEKDVYQIFNDFGCNLLRYRLWHTPSWYDTLNTGQRYSDLDDVKKSISRAKAVNMEVLLDFHLSDRWADPSNQLVPSAWLDVVDDTALLGDSLYNYVYATLVDLNEEGLCPEMLQVGNETNRGILLSPEDNQSWTLDWERNATLFNRAISAVRNFQADYSKDIQIVLHVADPEEGDWYIGQFIQNGVTDFDVIGLSYYWQWHQPLGIDEIDDKVIALREEYGKEVLIVETGYQWTSANNDGANNILYETYPDFSEVSPEMQKQFLIDLAEVLHASGAMGLIYWEPAWQSSPCYTPWGQGSHLENASFFDFDNELILPGGIEWMQQDYLSSSSVLSIPTTTKYIDCKGESVIIKGAAHDHLTISVFEAASGKNLMTIPLDKGQNLLPFNFVSNKLYYIVLFSGSELLEETIHVFFD